MAAGTLDEDSFLHCFEDVISLLNVCEEEQNSISRPFIEFVINRLESAAKFDRRACRGDKQLLGGTLASFVSFVYP